MQKMNKINKKSIKIYKNQTLLKTKWEYGEK
jgi:hypothetical protein